VRGRLIAYLGGIRCGKSRLAEERFSKEIKGKPLKPVYLATLDSEKIRGDKGIQARLREHRQRRPAYWDTIEIGRDLAGNAGHKAMLLDGLGMWVSLRLTDSPDMVLGEAGAFAVSASKALAVLVLDEAGQGGIAASPQARRFADLNGRVNQLICAAAHEVWRVDAGIAIRLR
jgi:adenosylcobinamide kinase/adenosylcobinamide-phosphate guanylyltransferase